MNKKHSTRRLIASITLFAVSQAVFAQLTPATFGDPAAEKYFAKFIDFPETHGDANVRLDCYGIVKTNGKLEGGCYIKNNWDPDFAAAVQKATKKGVLVPAMNGDKKTVVVLLFQVRFTKVKDDRSIDLILNPGVPENVDAYGPDHIAPQRTYGKEKWMSVCPKHAEWLVYARAHVDETGEASSVDLEHANGIRPTGPCLQSIIETIETSTYSPTVVDGIPVPSSYVEAFGG